jgi:hypothetical protein
LQASGELFFSITVPEGSVSLSVDTCSSATNFDTMIWITTACPSKQLNSPDVLRNDRGAYAMGCASITDASGSATWIQIPSPSPGVYYIMVEGYGTSSGSFGLNYDLNASPSPSPPPPSASPSPSLTPTSSVTRGLTPTSTPSPS